MKRTVSGNSGMTLIEIMVVVFILALLAALIAPRIMGRSDDAKIADAKVQIRNIETGLKLFKLDNGFYPSTEQGLQTLVEKPAVRQIPKNYKAEGYLESRNIPKDPWGNDYTYISPGEHGDYDICSFGADGVKGGEGKDAEICSWDIR